MRLTELKIWGKTKTLDTRAGAILFVVRVIQIEDTATEKVENEDDDGLVDWLPAVKSLVPRGPGPPSNGDQVSGEGDGGENVHDGVIPEQMNGSENRLLGRSDGGDEMPRNDVL